MAFGKFEQGKTTGAMAEINMVPLIDVMLVLLVVFMITAPMMNHGVKLQLPKVSSTVVQEAPETVNVSVDASGAFFWNEDAVDLAVLESRMQAAAALPVQPTIRLRVDEVVPYRDVADIMGASARAGLANLQFVTSPAPAVVAEARSK
ncbi:ExbD/TolR family protein [Leeia oryzae]|uniref:ExbD/TolR family protein n=1 Tax=Leeia oryzae TaxID=356662 RepID=UPI0003633BAD|nr:biopolymer transporter ExbD [Leeia oryzae]